MKHKAKKLRGYLAEQGISITHSQSLEAIAKVHGFKELEHGVGGKLLELA